MSLENLDSNVSEREVRAFVATCILAVTIVSSFFLFAPSKESRELASVQPKSKWQTLMAKGQNLSIHTNKVHGLLKVDVETREKYISNLDKPFEIVGTIHPKRDLDSLRLKWMLPNNYRLVSGDLEFEVFGLQKSVPIQTLITVQRTSPEDTNIFLEAYRYNGDMKFGSVGTLQTKHLKSEYREDLQQKAHFQFLKQEGKQKKVFQ